MKYTPYKTIIERARALNQKLTAYAFSGDTYVRVRTDEGFACDYPAAFALLSGDWYMVFSEHRDPDVFHKDDVTELYEYKVTRHQFYIRKARGFRPRTRKV